MDENYDYPPSDHVIIWLDAHIGESGKYQQLKDAFTSSLDPRHQTWIKLTDPDIDNLLYNDEGRQVQFAGVPIQLLAFNNLERCYASFEPNKEKHVCFITSGSMGEQIIPRLIENYAHLIKDPITNKPYGSIYVFCSNIEYHYSWLCRVEEYIQVFTHEADLLLRMTGDVAEYYVVQGRRCLEKGLLRYQWSKKLFTQCLEMKGSCVQQMKDVEKMLADLERIFRPHVNNSDSSGDHINETNDKMDEQPSKPCN